jgi:hypothetical protein
MRTHCRSEDADHRAAFNACGGEEYEGRCSYDVNRSRFTGPTGLTYYCFAESLDGGRAAFGERCEWSSNHFHLDTSSGKDYKNVEAFDRVKFKCGEENYCVCKITRI